MLNLLQQLADVRRLRSVIFGCFLKTQVHDFMKLKKKVKFSKERKATSFNSFWRKRKHYRYNGHSLRAYLMALNQAMSCHPIPDITGRIVGSFPDQRLVINLSLVITLPGRIHWTHDSVLIEWLSTVQTAQYRCHDKSAYKLPSL